MSGVETPAEGSGRFGAGGTECGESSKREGHQKGCRMGFRAKTASSPMRVMYSLWLPLARGLVVGMWMKLTHSFYAPLGNTQALFSAARKAHPLLSGLGSVEAGTCSLSCREQDGSVCLIRSGPSPRLSTTTRAHPRIRQRKDASCLPACWH